MHQVKENDTLVGISLRYDIAVDLIRMANDFTGDDIYFKKEIIIPYTNGMIYKDKLPATEQEQKEGKIVLMNQALVEKYKDQPTYREEAKYYLEITSYDLEKALDEFEEDMKFEKEHKSKMNKKKK